jgi:hypothetical protein
MSTHEAPLPEFPRSLKQAMAFQTIALLLRRHQGQGKLRLAELHPGGGTYDCLALVGPIGEPSLCIFNLAGSSLLLRPRGRPVPPPDADAAWHDDLWCYPPEYLAAGGAEFFVARIEARLGLTPPKKMPAASPSSVSVSVLAQLAQRFALSAAPPFFRSGWHDSAGMEGSSVCPWVADFPKLQARCDAARDDWPKQALAAGRLWGIGSEKFFERPDVVIDVATGQVYRTATSPAAEQGSLWSRYQKGTGIRELAWWVETLWKG